MSSKERDRFAERSKSPDLLKMKAVTSMCSGEEGDIGKTGASWDEQGRDQQQISNLNRRFSAESQEFEFNKLGGLTSSHDLNEDQLREGGVLASADELFYKGQLLPLQYNTRAPPYINSITYSPISPWQDTIEIPSPKLSLSSLRDQDVKFSSCRMDHVSLDSSLFDFTRSSSFRSHSSYYYYANYGSNCTGFWDSSTTNSYAGESTSSSRDSNGSSQDSYSSSDHNKEQHVICCQCNASAGRLNAPLISPFPKKKPGLMQSWKILFNGLRRSSSHFTTAWRDHQVAHNPSFHGSLSARAANIHAANQGAKPAACESKLSNEKRGSINEGLHIRSLTSKTSLLKAQEEEKGRSNGSQTTRENKNPNFNKKEGEIRRDSYSMRGSRWQGYTRRLKPISVIKASLVRGHANYDHDQISSGSCNCRREQKGQAGEGWPAQKGRVTCQMPSLERKLSQPSLVSAVLSGVKGPSKVSFRFHTVSSSCPASVRSSPNHSGLLVASPANHSGLLVASPAFNNMSTMQELHSAVQGAIAHCKQSISSPSS